MERLTEHFGRYIRIKGLTTIYCSEYSKTARLNNAIIKLAAYYDAMPLERVQELAQAEKDGRLVMLTPNALLTLGEMRDMDGEAVWVIHPHEVLPPFRGVVSAEDESVANEKYCANFGDYTTEWLAYRRKPEEGAT